MRCKRYPPREINRLASQMVTKAELALTIRLEVNATFREPLQRRAQVRKNGKASLNRFTKV
ncbi:MAG: hypothetical protein ACTS80_00525 [Candidatus Hodgkinia cicadicola]